MSDFLKSVMAGVSISFAGIVYLSSENSVVGAFLFSLGLLTIYHFGWHLFTGKACYFLSGKKGAIKLGGIAFLGNTIGCLLIGYLFRFTKLIKLEDHVVDIATGKLSYSFLSAFIMAIGCGFMMYIAVTGFANNKSEIGRHLLLILAIMVFIISGFEHVVANLFYFSFANIWDLNAVVYIIVFAIGNIVGCNIIPLVHKCAGSH